MDIVERELIFTNLLKDIFERMWQMSSYYHPRKGEMGSHPTRSIVPGVFRWSVEQVMMLRSWRWLCAPGTGMCVLSSKHWWVFKQEMISNNSFGAIYTRSVQKARHCLWREYGSKMRQRHSPLLDIPVARDWTWKRERWSKDQCRQHSVYMLSVLTLQGSH